MTDERVAENIYELMKSATDAHPDNTAIVYINAVSPTVSDTQISFKEFQAMMNQTARLIHHELDGRRAVVAMLLPNMPQSQAILWGGSAVSIIDPLNPLLDEDTMVKLLDSAEAEIIFALGPQERAGIWEKAVAVASKAKTVKKLFSVAGAIESSGYPDYTAAIREESMDPLPQEWLPGADEIATYFHTGGTTGVPKLAMLSHRNHVVTSISRGKYSGLEAGEVIINGLPIFHVGGATLNSLAMLAAGVTIILPTIEGYRNAAIIQSFWQLVERYKIASNICAPTSMAAIMEVPVGEADISSLRISVSGGTVVPDSVIDRVLSVTGHRLLQIYAMTETSGLTALPSPHVVLPKGCAGWIPPEVEIRIGDGSLNAGEAGEIFIHSEAVFKGYLNHADNPIDRDGWLASGDLGYLDEEGRLYISGRSKDLIIRGGHNIDPVAIESCLERHPAVNLAAAVGKPDAYAGELPIAYVELHTGRQASAKELHDFALRNIHERPACPKQVFVLDALPLTAVGKIHKPTLREKAAELVVEEALTEQFPTLKATVVAEIAKSGEMHVNVSAGDVSAEVRALLAKMQSELKLVISH